MAIPLLRSSTDTPARWRTLAVLTAAVLLLHLWGLGVDPLQLGSGSGEPSATAMPANVPTTASRDGSAASGATAPVKTGAVAVTQVRWVEPTPPPLLAVQPKRQAPASKPGKTKPVSPDVARAAAVPVTPPPEPDAMRAVEPLAADQDQPPTTPETDQVAQAEQPTEPTAPAATLEPPATPTTAPPAAPALPPSQPPASTRLAYDIEGVIKGLTYRASGTFDWTLAAGRYEARTEMSMFLVGSRVQTSAGTVGPDGLRPERFSDKRRSEVATHFEQGAGRIRFSGNAPEAVLMPGAQDRLSLFMQLAGLLQARPHVAGDVIEFQVAGTGDAEPWRFEVGELQELALPAGTVPARWIRRLPRKPHDSTVEMWLAPSMNHLPVRLRISQANGDVADQRLTRMP